MKLGNLFKAVVKLPLLPIAVVADIVTMGARKAVNDEFFVEKTVDSIAEEFYKANN